MFWNFVIHQIFPQFLQPLRDFRTCASSTLKLDTSTGEVSLSVRSSFSRVSLSLDDVVGEEDELEEDVEHGLSCLEGVLEVE